MTGVSTMDLIQSLSQQKKIKVKRSQKANLIKEIKNALGVIEGTTGHSFFGSQQKRAR